MNKKLTTNFPKRKKPFPDINKRRTLFSVIFFFLSLFSLINVATASDAPRKVYLDDNKRYLAIMLVNDNETADFRPIIQAGHDVGFNAVYVTVRWDVVKCFNANCILGNDVDPNWDPANRYWSQIDQEVQKAKDLGMKIAFRIHLGSADLKGFSPSPRSKYLWGGDDNSMRKPDGSVDLGGYNFRHFSFADAAAVDSAKLFIADVLNRYGYLENEGNLLFVSTTAGTSQEMEYAYEHLLDYSGDATNAYSTWYQNNYGTTNPNVPQDFSSVEGRKWYKFRHQQMKNFVDQVSAQINAYNSNIKYVLDYGSAFDAASARRGTFGFKSMGENTDGVKVNDAEFYDHRFSMDILRTSFPNRWIMNEALTRTEYLNIYGDWINQSFAHGAKLFAVVTNVDHLNQMSATYSQIVNDWITPAISPVSTNGSVSYSVSEVLDASFPDNKLANGSRNIYQEWLNIYNSNPSNAKPVNVYLDDSELDGGGCPTPPAAPTVSASPSTINSGSSSTLSASGCSGGTVTWSDGLGTGTSKSVTLTATKTYTATCSIAGCTSSTASVTVTVVSGDTSCLEAESMAGNGAITSDPNASNGQTRGEENNYNHYVDYVITGVPAAGTYNATLRYYSSTAPVVGVQVNGGSTQTVNLASSGSWNIVWTEQQFNVTLAAGNNTIRVQGTGGGSCRQDKLCVDVSTSNPCSTPPAAPSLSASPANIAFGATSTLSASGCSGGTITWSNGLGTGSTKSVSPATTTTYAATCTVDGCTSSSASVTVMVSSYESVCLEAEQMSGNGNISSDPNASNGQTRGEENNYNHYVDYQITNVPAAGTYGATLRYYSSSAPVVSVQVNGGSSQTINLANSGSWNIAWTQQQFNVTLAAGTNTIRVQGTGGGSCRQDRLCVELATGAPCSTPPAAPSLSASPSSITSGSSAVLTASGCSGTVTWSDGLGTGSSKTVSPTSNATYTASCSVDGCTSASASITVTIVPPTETFNQCLESESMSGNGSITNDPNASNGSTRGDESNNNHYVDYAITGVPAAGNYTATLRYYSSSAPTVGVQVNGGSSQTVNLANSGSWNIVWTTQQFTVTLAAGSNTIRISGTGGGSCRQDQLCVNTPGSSVVLGAGPQEFTDNNSRLPLTVFPNPSRGVFETNFYLESGKKAHLIVSDMVGRTIYSRAITGKGMHREKIALSNKASGLLLLRLISSDKSEVKKINITR